MFEQALTNRAARTARPVAVTVSAAAQAAIVTFAMLAPLIFLEPLPAVHPELPLLPVMLVPPVPKPPAAPRGTASTNRRAVRVWPLVEPGSVPKTTPVLVDDSLPELASGFDTPSSAVGAMMPTSLLSGVRMPTAPPPPPVRTGAPAVTPPPAAPVRAGGIVRAPTLVEEIRPEYPLIAQKMRISGVVRLEAVIARDGSIRSLKVVSGHPLLTKAARDAVAQWRYQPTLLNGEPVEVALSINVSFTLR